MDKYGAATCCYLLLWLCDSCQNITDKSVVKIALPRLGRARAVFLVALGRVVAVVERVLLRAGLAVAVRTEERYPTPAAGARE